MSASSKFYAKTSVAKEWKSVVAAVKTVVEEAMFTCNAEGMKFSAMDPSHIALVVIDWPKEGFERYECPGEYKFSVRVEDFTKLMGRTDNKDSVEMTAQDDQEITLKLINGYKREFKMHLIETGTGPSPIPKMDFDVNALMNKPVFEKVLGDVSVVADQITIGGPKGAAALSFSGKSDIGAGTVELDKNGADIFELDVKEETRSTYNIEYVLGISKAIGSITDQVRIQLSTKKPIQMEFKLNEFAKLNYYLAPRIVEG